MSETTQPALPQAATHGHPIPPRGRPAPVAYALRPPSIRKRAELRELGAQVLARLGGERAMGELARIIGMRPARIANFYPRKHDLIFDILHAHFDGIMEHVGTSEQRAAAHEPTARLAAMVLAYLEVVLAYRDEQTVALTLLDTLPAQERDLLRHQLRLVAFRLAAAIEAAVPMLAGASALRVPAAMNLLATLNLASLWFRDGGRLSREDFAQLTTQQAIAGVTAVLGLA